jgi:DnaJ homolog subfamily C member 19
MVIVIASLLAATAFVVLVRLLWVAAPARRNTLITIAAAVLVLGLALLAATGRLHWLAALIAAAAPFLRRGLRLLRYVPWFGSLLGSLRDRGASAGPGRAEGAGGGRANGAMTRVQALEILGLASNSRPSRDDIKSAHRRLIQKVHPDRGGSKYLAQQLNEAKHRLLNEP